MKKQYLIFGLILSLLMISCVQKTHKRTIVFTLDTNSFKNIGKVGIRRNDIPLNWNSDYEMTLTKDSLYKAIVTLETGYKGTMVKFSINDEFELQNQQNREVIFTEKDTTFYKATFDVRN